MTDADLIEELRSIATAIRGTEPAIERAAETIARLVSERDDARRMACGALAAAHMNQDPFWRERVAKTLGWDCYPTEGK